MQNECCLSLKASWDTYEDLNLKVWFSIDELYFTLSKSSEAFQLDVEFIRQGDYQEKKM
jgi:hypothetical protein